MSREALLLLPPPHLALAADGMARQLVRHDVLARRLPVTWTFEYVPFYLWLPLAFAFCVALRITLRKVIR